MPNEKETAFRKALHVDQFSFCSTAPEHFEESLEPRVTLASGDEGAADLDVHYVTESPLPAGSLVCSSSILVTLEPLSTVHQSGMQETAAALAGHLMLSGLLQFDSPRYWPLLNSYIAQLWPRCFRENAEISTQQNFVQLLQKTIACNGVSDGRATHLIGCGSFFNHSCLPNVYSRLRSSLRVYEFYAWRAIEDGESLCTSYLPFPIDSEQARRAELGFECGCAACSAEGSSQPPLPSEYALRLDSLPLSRHCWQCGARGPVKLCQACGTARYCSRACQRQNWNTVHQRICKAWRERTNAVTCLVRGRAAAAPPRWLL